MQLTGLLLGGLPVGAITEVHGSASSGRTSLAFSLAAAMTEAGGVAAWIDTSDSFDPEAAALSGVELERLLWVRCGALGTGAGSSTAAVGEAGLRMQNAGAPDLVPASYMQKLVGNGGCGSPHPRGEGRGIAEAIDSLLHSQPRSAAQKQRRASKVIGTPGAPNRDVAALPFPNASPYREEQVATDRLPARRFAEQSTVPARLRRAHCAVDRSRDTPAAAKRDANLKDDWGPLDQALRAADLLLQSGGFNLLVLDLGDIPANMAWRIPLATWFRFRAGCEWSRSILLVISQHPCARTSADLTVAVALGSMQSLGGTVAVGNTVRLKVEQQRRGAEPSSNVVPLRKPVRSDEGGLWTATSHWGIRA